jgi:hypothetical protein
MYFLLVWRSVSRTVVVFQKERMCYCIFSFVEYTEHQTKCLFQPVHYLSSTTPHRTVSSKHLLYFNTAISDSREQSANRIFRPSSRRMFERFVIDMCVFQRIHWKLLVVKCVAYSGCLYFKTAHTKIVRSVNVDYSADGNSKLLRNICRIPGDWNHLHRHCCENLNCSALSSSRALQFVKI